MSCSRALKDPHIPKLVFNKLGTSFLFLFNCRACPRKSPLPSQPPKLGAEKEQSASNMFVIEVSLLAILGLSDNAV